MLTGVFVFGQGDLEMATAAQIAANQENAQKSTGPSEEGKAASCMNNFRHGLAGGGFYFLEEEDADEYDALLNALMTEHNADTATELILVEKMAKLTGCRSAPSNFRR